ncbi:MAG TPA: MBL fold metallo-hydrolase [Chloroflexota bacterium]|nr:MBL fold metallo-hydrolase [Chloroflexota bacterium]
MVTTTPFDAGLTLIDLGFQRLPGVIASYLVESAGERALLEVGPTSTIETLLAGLTQSGVQPESISKVLVTHIHLDHAGAAGTFLRRFPRAHLYVHAAGLPHLVDPSRLLASATRIYGEMMDVLWGDVEPVPADRVTALADGDVVTVGDRQLRALHTPGHASHHVVFHDEQSREVFTGDVAAVRLPDFAYVRPPTPPPELDLELWTQSLQRLSDLAPRRLYLTHFGPFDDVDRHLQQVGERLGAWEHLLRRAVAAGQDRPAMVDTLRQYGDRELLTETNDATALERYELATPYGMSVDGYLRYFRRHP